jgi:hypothetical protein
MANGFGFLFPQILEKKEFRTLKIALQTSVKFDFPPFLNRSIKEYIQMDFSGLSKEDLIGILMSLDAGLGVSCNVSILVSVILIFRPVIVQDITNLSYTELSSLARTLFGSDSDLQGGGSAEMDVIPPHDAPHIIEENVDIGMPSDHHIDTNSLQFDTTSILDTNQFQHNDIAIDLTQDEQPPPSSTESIPMVTSDPLTTEQQTKIRDFCDISECDENFATVVLQVRKQT